METSPTPPVMTIPPTHGQHMPEALRQRHPDSVPCLSPLTPPRKQTTTLTRTTLLMELGSQQMRPRSRSQGPLPRTPQTERTRYIAFLIPKTNRLFADRYQLDSHWDQLLSLFGQTPLITPRVTQIWKYLQRQQKRILIQMDLVYLWCTSLYRLC